MAFMEPDPQEMETRRQKALYIIAHPGEHKVCEGCGSIVLRRAAICQHCRAYRFDERPNAIIARAAFLGSRPSSSPKYDS